MTPLASTSRDHDRRGSAPQGAPTIEASHARSRGPAKDRAALRRRDHLGASTGAPDDAYERVAEVFSPEEVVALTLAIVAVNGWNRLVVSMRTPVGSYRPPASAARDHEGEVAAGQR